MKRVAFNAELLRTAVRVQVTFVLIAAALIGLAYLASSLVSTFR